jgi:hypothetical protein
MDACSGGHHTPRFFITKILKSTKRTNEKECFALPHQTTHHITPYHVSHPFFVMSQPQANQHLKKPIHSLPPVVDNLSECLKKRNYPEGYEVDYMFPPVGCAKESVAIYVANDIYWACRRAAKGIDVTSHRANLASPSQKL